MTKLSLINNGKKVHSLHNSENKLLIHCINREVYDIWMEHFSNLKCFRCEYKITCSRINEKKCKPLERSSRAYIKSVHWKEKVKLVSLKLIKMKLYWNWVLWVILKWLNWPKIHLFTYIEFNHFDGKMKLIAIKKLPISSFLSYINRHLDLRV